MKTSVIATETLKLRSRRGSDFRRDELEHIRMIDAQDAHVGAAPHAALRIASVAVLKTSMKETGPEAMPIVERTTSPAGRKRENAKPVPPPVCWIIAAHFTASKMSGIASPTGRTKQAESCPAGLPAFISVGELGRNSSVAIAS